MKRIYFDFRFKYEFNSTLEFLELMSSINIHEKISEQHFENYATNEQFQLIDFDVKQASDFFISTNNFVVKLRSGNNELNFQCLNGWSRIFGKVDPITVGMIERFLCSEVLVAFFVDSEMYSLSLRPEFRIWEKELGYIPDFVKVAKNPKALTERDSLRIDLESTPLHIHQMTKDESLWFGSASRMYFSEIYYKYIPRFLWDNFSSCIENTVMDCGLRKIILNEELVGSFTLQFLQNHFSFRNDLGIDSIAHELCPGERSEVTNPKVFITRKDCRHGSIHIRYFVDSRNQIVSPELAVFIVESEYLDDGVTEVFFEKTKVSS